MDRQGRRRRGQRRADRLLGQRRRAHPVPGAAADRRQDAADSGQPEPGGRGLRWIAGAVVRRANGAGTGGRRRRPVPHDLGRQLRGRRRELAGLGARLGRPRRRSAPGAVADDARPQRLRRPPAGAVTAPVRRARVRVLRRNARPAAHRSAGPRHPGRPGGRRGAGPGSRAGRLLLSVASAVRDERAELFDLEAQGVAPHDLRTELRLRAALVGGAGLIAGLLVGALLSRLAADLVQVAAGGGAPQPPLEPRAGWVPLLAGILLFGLLAWAGIGVLTRIVFSRPLPRRPTGVAP